MKYFIRFTAPALAGIALLFAENLSAQLPQTEQEGNTTVVQGTAEVPRLLEGITVTARRVEETAQEVPIPLSVIDGGLIERSGAINTHRLQQLVPSVQFFTTNPRNSFLNIRGQGLPFGLTNDGIEPGVGLYVDGVFYARPGAATFDFVDVERIEVLRGPQGTLYGKNTTAGALNVTTRAPSFTESDQIFELSTGNYGYLQTKGSVSAPLASNLATRVSFVSTQREGLIRNVRTGEDVNSTNNVSARAQLRYLATERLAFSLVADITRQRPVGYAQVIAGVVDLPFQQENRKFAAIAEDLGYSLPSTNPFDRVIDHNSRWGAGQDSGGASLSASWDLGRGELTAISAWRYWDWDPSNDRDWTGTDFIAVSQAPSHHEQLTQEIRYAGEISRNLNFVVGLFGFRQTLDAKTVEVQGADSWRWSLNPNNALVQSATPERLSALLNGRGQTAYADLTTTSAALFAQLQWKSGGFSLAPGLRLNYDAKKGSFEREVYGGADDPELNSLKTGSAYYFDTDLSETNVSGQLTGGYALSDRVNSYATYSTSFKSFGFNLSALPTVNGQPDLTTARIAPESVRHIEIGVKTSPAPGITANLNVFSTDIEDFQTNVRDPDPSQPRAIVAGVDLVRIRGAEFDGSIAVNENLSLYGSVAYNDGQHVKFPNAIPSLEQTGVGGLGAPERVDISGSALPGLPKWGVSVGGDLTVPVGTGGTSLVLGANTNYRSEYSSSTTPSQYLVADARTLVDARAGVQLSNGWSFLVWSRNVLDKQYLEQLGQAGNAGLYWGVPGDPRTFGVTARWEP